MGILFILIYDEREFVMSDLFTCFHCCAKGFFVMYIGLVIGQILRVDKL
jgi:hypothetical protein